MKKKVLTLLLAAVMGASVCACGSSEKSGGSISVVQTEPLRALKKTRRAERKQIRTRKKTLPQTTMWKNRCFWTPKVLKLLPQGCPSMNFTDIWN